VTDVTDVTDIGLDRHLRVQSSDVESQKITNENDDSYNRVNQINSELISEKEHPSPSSVHPSQVSQASPTHEGPD
jgi:hypothetical protein